MNELIERYVLAVARRLPPSSRDDVARELRATIDDMLDARGSRDEDEVRAVLVELGDPKALAAGYRGGPQHLIGPEVYDTFLQTTRAILTAVLPIVVVLQIVFADWDEDRSVAAIVVTAVLGALQIGVHIVFWTGLTFVIVERTGAGKDVAASAEEWTPDQLPALPPDRSITLGDFIASVVVVALVPIALVWQHRQSAFSDAEGRPIPLLDPDLWRSWFPVLLGIVAVNLAIEVWKLRAGRWTMPLLLSNLALNVAFAGYFVALFAAERVWNPEYSSALAAETDLVLEGSVVEPITIAVVVLISAWDVADSVVKYLRQGDGAAATAAAAPTATA